MRAITFGIIQEGSISKLTLPLSESVKAKLTCPHCGKLEPTELALLRVFPHIGDKFVRAEFQCPHCRKTWITRFSLGEDDPVPIDRDRDGAPSTEGTSKLPEN